MPVIFETCIWPCEYMPERLPRLSCAWSARIEQSIEVPGLRVIGPGSAKTNKCGPWFSPYRIQPDSAKTLSRNILSLQQAPWHLILCAFSETCIWPCE